MANPIEVSDIKSDSKALLLTYTELMGKDKEVFYRPERSTRMPDL